MSLFFLPIKIQPENIVLGYFKNVKYKNGYTFRWRDKRRAGRPSNLHVLWENTIKTFMQTCVKIQFTQYSI